ncbi:hypothetical protein DBR39_00840 [Chryseobacterium sp. KBW03]|uniref:DEAD/DEAH box helicase n=1 Tax=Chryseobacterium sp. KBW03 TaxID=2153362 RepID=UPI000F59AA9C|nr:DEAD/DEAH box helicase [Chryseobacterium sp. KBW03]RQO42454.1 hypothetical protein DBR39_00840 [Chryseobacterium sp. KBW03]
MISILHNLDDSKKIVIKSVDKLKESGTLEFSEFKVLLENTYSLLNSNDDDAYNIGLYSICHIGEYLPIDNFLLQLLNDCIVSSRVFLYKEMLPKKIKVIEDSFFDSFAKEIYTLDSGTVLTKDQKKLFRLFNKHKRLIVSAPTSFGKSRIIEEIIIHNDYTNIAIILPTIALLSETYIRFNANPNIKENYNLINSLGLADTINKHTKNIFILTPEKMDMLLDERPDLKIDFFVMDEIYKIQDDEDRKGIFSNCLYRLSKMKTDFYLIGPYFDDFSPRFREITNSHFEKFDSEIVQKDVYNIFDLEEVKFTLGGKKIKKLKDNKKNLKNILTNINGQTLIYNYRKDYVEKLANDVVEILHENNNENVDSDLIDYISDNISSEWSLVKALKKGVAFHHGAVPRYIQTEIIDSFNNQEIDIIVCTTTITEGVNTSAKNVILYSNVLGKKDKPLTGFEVKNIKGRAGRFRVHFIGRVFYFHKSVENDKTIILVDYYDKENLSSEDIIQIDKEDLKDENLKRRNKIEELLHANKIPLSLIKKNKYIPINKQITFINFLRQNPILLQLVYFKNKPDKQHLDEIFTLTRNYLFSDRDLNDKSFIYWELNRLLKYYIYYNPSIKQLITEQKYSKTIDAKIRSAFKLITHYFEFAFPRYFRAFENIYNFVYNEYHNNIQNGGISLQYIITLLEFGFVKENEIALKEAGLPNDIVRKVSERFGDCNSLEQVRSKYRLNPNIINNLTLFEQKMFRKYI